MSFDPAWLFLSMIASGVGFVLLTYGRRRGRLPQVVAGVAFLVYPYFASSVTALVAIGAALGAGLWTALRMGW